jgi:outer membrane biogenesis lipoprotein LolB
MKNMKKMVILVSASLILASCQTTRGVGNTNEASKSRKVSQQRDLFPV